MENILKKAIETHSLSKEDIIILLNSDGQSLFAAADKIRQKYVGNAVHLRGLIEFTNICKCRCKYCGIRVENNEVSRYRMSPEEIILHAKKGRLSGFRTIVLQGGEDAFYTKDVMCNIIREIKKLDVALTLSIGERTSDDYKAFKEAGADRYLLRIETTDRALYKNLHPNMDFDNRLRCLYDLKRFGYETGTGCLIGLPGQTVESLAEDILFFKELDADMVGVGPFLPHPHTPLKDCPRGSFDLALKVLAITRLLLPGINIPATTAMETIVQNGRVIALRSGANVFMPNISGIEYTSKYEIYPDKSGINADKAGVISNIDADLKAIGRYVSADKGFRSF